MNVSVIIPTRNRASLLQKTIQKLAHQLVPGDEVLVIDDHSQDDTWHLVQRLAKLLPLIFVPSTQFGPSAARNLGFSRAKNEIIAFLDDDCFVQKGWRKNLENNIHSAVQTQTIFQGKITHLFIRHSVSEPLFHLKNTIIWESIIAASPWKKRSVRYLNTGNMYFHKSALREISPLFDNISFPFVGEETDLAYRLHLAGKRILFTPDVLVNHQKIPLSIKEKLGKAYQLGRAENLLQKKYLANRKTQKLFSKELKKLDKNPGQLSLSWQTLQRAKNISIPTSIFFMMHFVFQTMAYNAGRWSPAALTPYFKLPFRLVKIIIQKLREFLHTIRLIRPIFRFPSAFFPYKSFTVSDFIFPMNPVSNFRGIIYEPNQALYTCLYHTHPSRKPGKYHPFIEELIINNFPNNGSCLHLGGGGMAMPLQLFLKNPKLTHSIVEIDAGFIEAGKKYFLSLVPNAKKKFTIFHDSIQSFVQNTKQKNFDVVIQDISVNDTAPREFSSQEWLKKLKKKITPAGIVIITVGDIGRQPEFQNMHDLHHYSRNVFRYCTCVLSGRNSYVILCNKNRNVSIPAYNQHHKPIIIASYHS